jgi:thiol-disulfide isomerase/thioredoxin
VEGAFVAIAVLVAATVFGLVRRHRDGRLRPARSAVRGRRASKQHDLVSERDRLATEQDGQTSERDGRASERDRLAPEEIGAELGERATLLQFSTAFCAPCRATRRVLGEVAAMVDGVVHVEIDAEARLDLVRRLNVIRTPTVLVLDGSGRIVRRASGAPRKVDVIAALGEAVP